MAVAAHDEGAELREVSEERLCAALGKEEYLLGLVDGSFVFVDSTTLSVARSIIRVKLSEYESSPCVGSKV